MSDIQLEGSLTIDGNDVSALVHSFVIHRTRSSVTVPPTLANRREVTKAGALVESVTINFHSSTAATSLWADVYDAIDTDDAEISLVGTLNPGDRGPDNPEFTFDAVVLGVDTGADVGALRQQSITLPITGAGITKNVSAPGG